MTEEIDLSIKPTVLDFVPEMKTAIAKWKAVIRAETKKTRAAGLSPMAVEKIRGDLRARMNAEVSACPVSVD